MASSVTLLMAVHCHQPVGNFGFVFEEAYAKAYEPFLRILEHHPSIRLALHYSGPLLDWLLKERPAFVARLRALAARGQVEFLASGYYEPVLPVIPEPDRQGQIALMRQAVRKHFGGQAQGLWLTERVWEPQLPETLADAGIAYTMIDTNQFTQAARWLKPSQQVRVEPFWDLLGSYTTDYGGKTVRLFPASKRLRYTMPFQEVSRTVEFLRSLRRQEPAVITFADDGEKFGLWPKTYPWVYEEGWLDQFFTALERESDWLATSTFQDYTGKAQADGHVYLPCGSYEEMLEWSNGHFRNFFTKYPEANAMQQAMLRISENLQQVQSSELRVGSSKSKKRVSNNSKLTTHNSQLINRARRALYAAQCNCAYWHGVFGGLYLSHLRRAVYSHLVEAESCLKSLKRGGSAVVAARDEDGDGVEELSLSSASQRLVVDPAEGACVRTWNHYGHRVNLLDTLTRGPEPYHQKLRASSAAAVAHGEMPASVASVASIHDVLSVKESNLSDRLIYDDHVRYSFLDYGFQSLPTLEEAVNGAWDERRLWSSSGNWVAEGPVGKKRPVQPLSVSFKRQEGAGVLRKTIQLSRSQAAAEFAFSSRSLEASVIALEFNLALRDEELLKAPRRFDAIEDFAVKEDWSGIRIDIHSDLPALVYSFPVETVSESEGGMERTFQGLCLVWLWPVKTTAKWDCRLKWTVN